MTHTGPQPHVRRAAVGLFAALALLALSGPAAAQPNGKELVKEPAKHRGPIREGYTRPGNPSDREENGRLARIAWDNGYKGKLIGGTVYFAVYERTGHEGDTWGTGLPGFDEAFVEGRSFQNTFSPALDTKARYLYLYMVVNDRGLDPVKEAFALNRNFATEPIASASVRLIVDPRFLTSWGHFKQAGFAARVPDRKLNGDVVFAEDGTTPKRLGMAFSANPGILAELPFQAYLKRSPAYPLRELSKSFGVNRSDTGLRTSAAYGQLTAKSVKHTAWQKNMLQAVKAASEPTHVQVLYSGTAEAPLPEERDGLMHVIFRADWQGESIVKLGQHSVLFGFTTDLPPVDEEVRIADPEASRRLNLMTVAADTDANGVVPGVAPGTVPTPAPPVDFAEAFEGATSVGPLGGLVAGGGGGVGGLGGGGFGALGGARPMTGGGGGFGGGTGGGNGGGTPTGTGSDTGTSTEPGTGNQGQNIFFNPVMANLQQQGQLQGQLQAQQQTSENCCTPPGEVIPEPGAVLLGLMGLPVLFVLCRRRLAMTPAA